MRLFVICHDDKSYKKAQDLCLLWENRIFRENPAFVFNAEPIFLKPSPYMESSVYPLLDTQDYKDKWKNEDYVGIVTYSILDKLGTFKKQKVDIDWVNIITQAKEKEVDAIGILCLDFKKGEERAPLTLIEGAMFHHGLNFYRAWRDLLLKMDYTMEQIDDNPNRSGFFCNWWVSRPAILTEYVGFIKKAMKTIEESPELTAAFYKNAHYGKGNTTEEQKRALFGENYYTMHPFIFERILSLYLFYKPYKVGSINRMVMRL